MATSLGIHTIDIDPDNGDPVGDVGEDINAVATTTNAAIVRLQNTVLPIAYFRGGDTELPVGPGAGTTAVILNPSDASVINEDSSLWSYDATARAMVVAEPVLIQASGVIRWDGGFPATVSDLLLCRIGANGTTLIDTSIRDERYLLAGESSHSVSGPMMLAAGQMVGLRVRHGDGSGQNLKFAQLRVTTLRVDS